MNKNMEGGGRYIKGVRFLRFFIFIGVIWFLLGVAYIPVNKIYQQGLVMLIYIPVFILIVFNVRLILSFLRGNRFFICLCAVVFLYVIVNGVVFGGLKNIKHVLYVFLFLFLGFFIVFFEIDNSIIYKTMLLVLLSVTAICLYSFYNFFCLEGNDIFSRMWGVLGVHHPILASYYVGFFLILSFMILYENNNFYIAPLVVFLSAFILFAQSRGAYISIFITILLYLLVFYKKNKSSFWVAIFFCIFCTVLGYLFLDQIMSRGSSYRPEIILSSINMGLNKLWFGHGIGHDFLIYTENYPEGFSHTHNLPLHIFIELGFLGLLLFSCLWASSFYICYKNKDLFLARFNVLIIIFSSIAFQFDAASFIAQPRLEWFVVWVPVCITVGVISIRFLEGLNQSCINKEF